MDKENLSPERHQYLKKIRRTDKLVVLSQIGILVVLLAAWEITGRLGLIDSFILSQPSRIIDTFLNMSQNGLHIHIGITIYETIVGFVLGVITGTLLAILLWWSKFISRVFEPYLVVLNSLPKIALGPVIIIIAGAGTRAIIFMALAISLIVTVLEMLNGFQRTDSELIKMAEA
ncbi:MAG TPA: ABC transporter permease, partial [Candidatus Avimonas sp.]|nr:ABC transporter permease [Candidatus Avimonas sp.]